MDLNQESSCFKIWVTANFLFFSVLSVTRPKLSLGHIVSGTSNHATYDVKTLMYLKFYEYSTLYLEQNMLPFVLLKCFIRGEY